MYELKYRIVADVDGTNEVSDVTVTLGRYATKDVADARAFEFMQRITRTSGLNDPMASGMKGSLETGWMTLMPSGFDQYIFVELV